MKYAIPVVFILVVGSMIAEGVRRRNKQREEARLWREKAAKRKASASDHSASDVEPWQWPDN